MANMNTRRLGVAVAVLGGYLYAVGGSDGTTPLNTGEISMKQSRISKVDNRNYVVREYD